MPQSYKKFLTFLFCISLFLSSFFAFASSDSPRYLVHLLEYLAQDYGAAVSEGRVTNAMEYQEQIELSQLAIQLGKNLKEFKDSSLQNKLSYLHEIILEKADSFQVKKLALEIEREVLNVSNLETSPSRNPNLQEGKELYQKNCAICHGIKGDGNGPSAATLNPKPANFLDQERMAARSSFQIYNTILLGIPKTAMPTFEKLSNQEIWDLVFYVLSFSQTSSQNAPIFKEETFIQKTKTYLKEALLAYEQQDHATAKQKALLAYLEGIEPLEPSLKTLDPAFTLNLEQEMGAIRRLIDLKKDPEELRQAILFAETSLSKAAEILQNKSSSLWFVFFMAVSIILREGFEAALIIISILGVLRVVKQPEATRWVHGGWILALALGGLAWVFSGWLMQMSGAGREMMEAITSLSAVVVLLYVGFWLHQKTGIKKWTAFIDGKTRKALSGGSFLGLGFISFMAVFREAFETVLFLRALWLEGGAGAKTMMALGVSISFLFIFVFAYLFLRFSVQLPIKKLFNLSSLLMSLLAVILMGKSFHAFQETGKIPMTPLSLQWRIDFLGFYPTLETLLAQGFILLFILGLYVYGKKSNA